MSHSSSFTDRPWLTSPRVRVTRTWLAVLAVAVSHLVVACGDGSELTRPRGIASVTVQPAQHTIVVGEEVALTARALDEGGDVVGGRTILWSSSDESIARVAPDGRVTALAAGTVQIRASVDGKVGSAQLVVTVVPVASIEVTPTELVLEVGQSRILTAITKDVHGTVLTGREVAWSVEGSSGWVSSSGVVVGMAPGHATITATSEGKAFAVAATVLAGAPSQYSLLYRRHNQSGVSDILALPFGTGEAPVLIHTGAEPSHPTAAPDGTRIAFAMTQFDGATQQYIDDIYAVDRNGTNLTRLTTTAGVDDQPSWSPVGGRIAYRHAEPDGRSDIWVMNPDGSNPVNLTADLPVTTQQSAPAWSADGARIAFVAWQTVSYGTLASIWTMRADGSDKRMITSTPSGFDATPAWSPDGQRIAFIRQYDSDADITIVSATGGEPVRLPLPGRQFTPAWSPDGQWIAFVQPSTEFLNLYTVRPNGTDVRLRTVDRAWGGGLEPTWIRTP